MNSIKTLYILHPGYFIWGGAICAVIGVICIFCILAVNPRGKES